ncbi:acyltransferase [Rhizoctonia solani]|uniref:Acyltransferase n=1 Tax=Rhizoctonia solani TaxID=456999 RepID=A0A8H8P898_9AGAM|nr:acyltransferase [Rhizoctonia solani]QRW25352.1 acyltransferase [Rhizoctonia solani]
MADATRPLSYANSDEKMPVTPSEPSSPPKAYDPHAVERGHPSPGEPITAVNSIILEEGLMNKEARSPTTPAAQDSEEPEIPVSELPLITGNTIQCAMAIAKLFTKYPHPVTENPWPTTVPEQVSWNPLAAEQWDWRRDTGLKTSDAQALASLLCFLFGAFCGRLGDHIGARKRAWLISTTFLQAMFTLGATLCCHANGESSFAGARGSEFANWGNVLGFCTLGFTSAAMGLQAHTGVRIGNIFNSSVVLTTIWVQFVGEPKLFKPAVIKQRDHKAIAVLGLIIGGIAGRALVDAIGSTWTFGIGAIIRVLIALSWLSIPAAKRKRAERSVS